MYQKIRLNHLKNKHKNQKGIIIGGGPSLKKEIEINYFNQLKNTNKYIIIGTNVSAFEIIEPDYYLFVDRWFWNNLYKKIDNLKNCIKLTQVEKEYGTKLKRPLSNEIIKIPTNGIFYPLMSNNKTIKCNNVGSCALSLSDYLGLSEIYLFGIDMKLDKNDKKNFHDYYKNKNKSDISIIKNVINNHYDNITTIIEKLEQKRINVFSCSKESRLNENISFINPTALF